MATFRTNLVVWDVTWSLGDRYRHVGRALIFMVVLYKWNIILGLLYPKSKGISFILMGAILLCCNNVRVYCGQ